MQTQNNTLPQTNGQLFLTDGGIETTLIFHEGYDLPYFAAFDLLKDKTGRESLKKYYETYAAIAVNTHTGFILETPTWRASQGWGEKIGYNSEQLANANRESVELLKEIKQQYEMPGSPFLISGCIGPQGDSYQIGDTLSVSSAAEYHRAQIETFADSGADFITALTMTYPEEAIGITKAAQACNIPVVISFTTETDGHLPNGMTLQQAIECVDQATNNGPAYYMINCAHPDHFKQALEENASWVQRIQGIRANASRMSHEELDEAEELDDGNPQELGQLYQALRQQYPQFNVLGGCCGTDHRHVSEIGKCCAHH